MIKPFFAAKTLSGIISGECGKCRIWPL